jgi:hypothetical protein
MAASNSIG